MVDIIVQLRAILKDKDIFEEIHHPKFKVDWQMPLPSLALTQRGWSEKWYVRILFVVRWDNSGDSRWKAQETINFLKSSKIEGYKWQYLSWWLSDDINESWKYETLFYMIFEENDWQ